MDRLGSTFPKVEKTQFLKDWCLMFDKKCYTQPINTCQAWTLRLNDQRRRPTPLYTNKFGVATGLNFGASMLRDGRRVDKERQCWPTLVPACDAAAIEGEEKADMDAMAEDFISAFNELGSDEIGICQKQVLGWMCSYRSAQPEKRSFASWRARWTRARKVWAGTQLQQARHRRPQAEQLAVQQRWKQRRRISKAGAEPS